MSGRLWRVVAMSVVLVVAVGVVGLFVIDVESTTPEPAEFDDTVSMGLSLADQYALEEETELPKAQVYYSQYEYVVGYYGVETFVETRRGEAHTQRFGYPLAIHVTDYSSVDVELTEEGFPAADDQPEWTDAETAWYVTDSDARTPAGETAVPFSNRADAEAFADAHDGTVLTWADLLEVRFDREEAAVVRDRVDDHHADADRRVEAVADIRERPVETVVGDDAATIQDAIDQAPSNTTVVVPEGEYDETLEIDRPLTLAGDGDVTIRGDGNGSVITSTADRTGVIGLEITGSGSDRRGTGELPGDEPEEEEWDATFEQNYAASDAGIALHTASDSLVEDVTVHSSATGVLLRRSGESVVRNATVYSPELPSDGHAGVLAFHSPIVIEESAVYDGRDSIYAHRSEEIAVRNNTFEGSRIGVHLMHTSDSLVANNRIRGQTTTGIYVMTGPERSAIVDNDIRDAEYGLFMSGSDSYVAGNVLADNRVGVRVDSTNTIYEHNVVAGNAIGAKERAMLPTNQIQATDFVGNDVHAEAGTGPLRIWTVDGTGNYWQGTFSLEPGDTDRAYSPTAAVDQRLHRVDGVPTLSRSPALDAITGLQGSVPGMRTGSIVDLEPTCEPNNPDLLERTDWADRAWSCDRTTGER